MRIFYLSLGLLAVFYFTPFSFTRHPNSAALLEWQNYTLRVATSKNAAFQWYKDNRLIPRATNNYLEIPQMVEGDAGIYYVQAKSGNRTITSRAAELKFIKLITAQIDQNKVTLKSPLSGKIYYTLDNSEPNFSSFVYSSPIPITGTTRIRAMINNIETDSYRITKQSLADQRGE